MELTQEYVDREGGVRRTTRYQALFEDRDRIPRRLPLLPGVRDSRIIVGGLMELLAAPLDNGPLPWAVFLALHFLPLDSLKQLVAWELVPEPVAQPGRRLVDYSEAYRKDLVKSRAATAKSAKAIKDDLDQLFRCLAWYAWSDVNAGALQDWYHRLPRFSPRWNRDARPKENGKRLLTAFVAFCDWVADHHGIPENPGPAIRLLLQEPFVPQPRQPEPPPSTPAWGSCQPITPKAPSA